jgi:hypothetical protein
MLRSYKFDSRRGGIILQEIETNPAKIPFQIVEPSGPNLSVKAPPAYAIKVTRETRATGSMMYLWSGDIAAEQQGFRVLGTGAGGTLKIHGLAHSLPATLTVRLYGMNALGKVYSLFQAYQLLP